jgi:KaiC/GvpD/RAD55 family RecA-like ATPase
MIPKNELSARAQALQDEGRQAERAKGRRSAKAPKGHLAGEEPEGRFLACLRADTVQRRPVSWLWPGRIARGKLTLIAGNPGLGKSQLTCALAGIITRGGNWPADGPAGLPADVVFLSAEDDPEDTIRPRLEAVGADLTRCHFAGMVYDLAADGSRVVRPFSIKDDLRHLGRLVADIGSVSMVVIDPVTAYLGNVDSHKNADVQALLSPLAAFAEQQGVAVVLVTHMTKATDKEALLRVNGSTAFVSAVRSAFVVLRDKGRPERRYFLPIKNNNGCDRTGYAFTIEPAALEGGITVSRVAWEAEGVTESADDIMAAQDSPEARSETEEAAAFLADLLAEGGKPVKVIKAEAQAAGFSWRTMDRARCLLKIEARKAGFEGGWMWSLPKNANPPEERQES